MGHIIYTNIKNEELYIHNAIWWHLMLLPDYWSPELKTCSRKWCFKVHGPQANGEICSIMPTEITCQTNELYNLYDDVMKWKHFPRYWPFVWGIHRSPVNSPHKGQWREALMFSLICAWINNWVNNDKAGDLRRHRAHYDVTAMWVASLTAKLSSGSTRDAIHSIVAPIYEQRLAKPASNSDHIMDK